MGALNELKEIGETSTMKTKLISWGITVGILTVAYQFGKRSGKNQQK